MTKEQMDELRKIVCEVFGGTDEFGPEVNMTDEFGWTSSGDTPVLMWEEGPYQWALEAAETGTRIAEWEKKYGVFVEAATSWCLAVFPL